jgi:multidrug resistance efflux pump
MNPSGYVVPVTTVQVAPKCAGQVIQVNIDEGSTVKKGDVLAQLDPILFEIDFKRALAKVERARARYEEIKAGCRNEELKVADIKLRLAEVRLKQATADLAQKHQLMTVRAGDAQETGRAESQVNEAQLLVEKQQVAIQLLRSGARKEQLAVAQAELAMALAERDRTQYLLECTKVVAPIDGTVLVKKAETGSTINPHGFAGSHCLCELADLNALEIDLWIPESSCSGIFKGQSCSIKADAFPELTLKGAVSRFLPVADRAKGAIGVRVRVILPEGDNRLRPESRAVVSFLKKRPPG